MSYLLIGLVALAAVSGLWGGWEHNRAAKYEAQVAERDAQIEQQNQAIEATKAEGDRRVAEASKGVKVATQATAKARSEAERLRIAASQPGAPSACPAGDAVALIRKGLGK